MPVEIMELVVKATIKEDKVEQDTSPIQKRIEHAIDIKTLTADIIEQVLEILHQQKER